MLSTMLCLGPAMEYCCQISSGAFESLLSRFARVQNLSRNLMVKKRIFHFTATFKTWHYSIEHIGIFGMEIVLCQTFQWFPFLIPAVQNFIARKHHSNSRVESSSLLPYTKHKKKIFPLKNFLPRTVTSWNSLPRGYSSDYYSLNLLKWTINRYLSSP